MLQKTLLALPLIPLLVMTNLAASEPIFEVNFAGGFGSGNTLTATTASGSAAPLASSEDAVFEDDLVAHSGVFGLRIGPGTPHVSYSVEKNLPASKGEVALQFNSAEWISATGDPWSLLQVGPKENLQLEVLRNNDATFTIQGIDSKGDNFSFVAGPVSVEKAAPVTLRIAYDSEHIQLFTGDTIVASHEWAGPPVWEGALQLGPSGNTQDGTYAVLSVLRIFPDISIQPEGKDVAGLPPGKTYHGDSTPWWELGQPRLGLEALSPERVPFPFTPISQQNDQVRVWGRDYNFDGSGILSQIVSAGHPLLAGPIRLRAEIDGQQVELDFGKPEILEEHPGKVVLRRIAAHEFCVLHFMC